MRDLQELAIGAFVLSVFVALMLVAGARPSSPLGWPEYYLGSLYLIAFAVCAWSDRRQPKPKVRASLRAARKRAMARKLAPAARGHKKR